MKIQTLFNISRQIALNKYEMEEIQMGLFKDFKEDFSQAVNEMMPGTETSAKDSHNLDCNHKVPYSQCGLNVHSEARIYFFHQT